MSARLTRLCLLGSLLAILVAPSAAEAAFPGKNGKIAYVRDGDIWTVNPDGTGRVAITTPARDGNPDWSPDGTEIAFDSTRDDPNPTSCQFCHYEIYVMDADGSDVRRVTTNPHSSGAASWSPDGSRIAFNRQSAIWTIAPDGSNETRVTPDDSGSECGRVEWGNPIWSPDGKYLVTEAYSYCDRELPLICFIGMGGEAGSCSVSTGLEHPWDWSPDASLIVWASDDYVGMYTDGTWHTTGFSDALGGAAWSPDGKRIVFTRPTDDETQTMLYTVDAAGGSNVTPLSAGDVTEFSPSWQPIPINSYPRPKAASATEISLVPAYQECSSPNRTHGPPLDDPSCAPPARAPTQLTVGTSDSNGRPTKSTSEVRIGVKAGILATSEDEADLRLSGTINDVRLASDLSDYAGSLSVRMTVRITDKDNTPHPGGPGAATAEDSTFSFSVACAATADTTVGGDCTFNSTAEAFVPGIVKEGRRAVWGLGQLGVYDSADNLFMRQGVFVP